MRNFQKAGVAFVAALATVGGGVAVAGSVTPTETVRAYNARWGPGDQINNGTGSFQSGDGAIGTGSYRMKTPADGDKIQIATGDYNGQPLSAITALSYATKAYTLPGVSLPAINIGITGIDRFRTAVYEPSNGEGNAAVKSGVWQTWNALPGKWWLSNKNPGETCYNAPNTLCTFNQLMASVGPNAKIAGLALNQGRGGGNTGLDAAVDAFSFQINGANNYVDFEGPASGPITCSQTAVRRAAAGGNDQADVTVKAPAGLKKIDNIVVQNGSVNVPTFTAGTSDPVIVTTTKNTQGLITRYSFDVTDVNGTVKHCA